MVDNFGVKYVGEEHAKHLMSCLTQNYEVRHEWKGEKCINITLNWDYQRKQVHLSMPGYVDMALTQFNHPYPTKQQDLPYPRASIKYGAKVQYAKTSVEATPLNAAEKKSYSKCAENSYFIEEQSTVPS